MQNAPNITVFADLDYKKKAIAAVRKDEKERMAALYEQVEVMKQALDDQVEERVQSHCHILGYPPPASVDNLWEMERAALLDYAQQRLNTFRMSELTAFDDIKSDKTVLLGNVELTVVQTSVALTGDKTVLAESIALLAQDSQFKSLSIVKRGLAGVILDRETRRLPVLPGLDIIPTLRVKFPKS